MFQFSSSWQKDEYKMLQNSSSYWINVDGIYFLVFLPVVWTVGMYIRWKEEDFSQQKKESSSNSTPQCTEEVCFSDVPCNCHS